MGEVKIEETRTYKLTGVEVFSAGKWNDDTYTTADLHDMVTAFENLKTGFRPYIKLGHDNNQNLVKSSGLPAIGWVEKLYVEGNKLLADFDYIPEKIFKLIKSKAYRKVSCEIYWNLDVNGTKYSRVLGAVALLGAENPGVMNLDDILGQYSFDKNTDHGVFKAISESDNFKGYSLDLETKLEENEMAETSEELVKIQADLEEQKKSYAQIEEAKKELEKTLETQAEELKQFRLEAEKARIEAETAKVAQFVSELETKKLVSPAMKDLVTELMSDKKEYAVKEKNYSKQELIQEILTLSKEAAKVNFDESSRSDFGKVDKDKERDEKIQKYMDEHKCSYGVAVKAVLSEMNAQKSEE